MDSQIDLTENRDFSNSFSKNIKHAMERMRDHGKYLWTWNRVIYKNEDNLILTGNRDERYFKKLPGWGTLGYCDCCGSKIIGDYPWLSIENRTLCKQCDIYKDEMLKQVKWNIPWKSKFII